MKRVYGLAAMGALFVLGATAQDDVTVQQMRVKVALSDVENGLRQAKVMAIGGAVMGPAVKNAPYSAVEVTDSTQMLADGNRIHQEMQVPVYRDSEGRVRRENSPDRVMIWDPVANVSYMLDPKTQTARKLPLGMNVGYSVAGGGIGGGKVVRFFDGPGAPPPPPLPELAHTQVISGGGITTMQMLRTDAKSAPKSESLGKQMIEGVNAEGTRLTSTLEAGAIGNDRPIQSVSENWYSPELQTLVKSVHTDPRTGEDTYQLTNINRAEPPSTLFQVPADYQIENVSPKMPSGLTSFPGVPGQAPMPPAPPQE